MKKETIDRKVRHIHEALDRIERGVYATLSIESVCDQIDWLWKFRHISEKVKDELCDRAVEVIDRQREFRRW